MTTMINALINSPRNYNRNLGEEFIEASQLATKISSFDFTLITQEPTRSMTNWPSPFWPYIMLSVVFDFVYITAICCLESGFLDIRL